MDRERELSAIRDHEARLPGFGTEQPFLADRAEQPSGPGLRDAVVLAMLGSFAAPSLRRTPQDARRRAGPPSRREKTGALDDVTAVPRRFPAHAPLERTPGGQAIPIRAEPIVARPVREVRSIKGAGCRKRGL